MKSISVTNANQIEDIVIEPYSGDSIGNTQADKLGGELDLIAFDNLISLQCSGNDIEAIYNIPDSMVLLDISNNKFGDNKLSEETFVVGQSLSTFNISNNGLTVKDVSIILAAFRNAWSGSTTQALDATIDMTGNDVKFTDLDNYAQSDFNVLVNNFNWSILLDT